MTVVRIRPPIDGETPLSQAERRIAITHGFQGPCRERYLRRLELPPRIDKTPTFIPEKTPWPFPDFARCAEATP